MGSRSLAAEQQFEPPELRDAFVHAFPDDINAGLDRIPARSGVGISEEGSNLQMHSSFVQCLADLLHVPGRHHLLPDGDAQDASRGKQGTHSNHQIAL